MSAANHWIVDVTPRNFENEVIARSRTMPIVLYFWATWCEPCKELGPLLTKRAEEGDGRFLLARVDLDQSPELGQALQVKGVPAVLAIVGGQLANGFEGALPAAEVDAFLDLVAPAGAGAAGTPLDEARALTEAGEHASAAACLETHLSGEPGDDAARLFLADLLLDLTRVEDAQAAFDALTPEARESPEGRALANRLEILGGAGSLESLRAEVAASPEDAAARLALGEALLAGKDYEAGFEELLFALRLDPSGVGVQAKAAMLGGFELLGLEDPIANDYRFKLSLELFA